MNIITYLWISEFKSAMLACLSNNDFFKALISNFNDLFSSTSTLLSIDVCSIRFCRDDILVWYDSTCEKKSNNSYMTTWFK